ncbi:hypothetical protein M3202_13810 [Alkalihalobacillus oceani]|uniref:Uncharacterized protein n=1 Tax=Halalkalibacter oceani TaxID=1653776 RepID=A0A9X2IPE9_9BACI|nr:hypothetical protein [Halalkalibacter oceani]MCM3715160.1 hypothetical protein [Halalkalibacter oceani]
MGKKFFVCIFIFLCFFGIYQVLGATEEVNNDLRKDMIEYMEVLKNNKDTLDDFSLETLEAYESLSTKEKNEFLDSIADPKATEALLFGDEEERKKYRIEVEEKISFDLDESTILPFSDMTETRTTVMVRAGVPVTHLEITLSYNYSNGRVNHTNWVEGSQTNNDITTSYELYNNEDYIRNGYAYGSLYYNVYTTQFPTISAAHRQQIRIDTSNNSYLSWIRL